LLNLENNIQTLRIKKNNKKKIEKEAIRRKRNIFKFLNRNKKSVKRSNLDGSDLSISNQRESKRIKKF
jgi:hypothetical protein